MYMSLKKDELKNYVATQISTFFPDEILFEGEDVDQAIDCALERVEYCFKHITLGGYTREQKANFSHLHSDQYSQFLYYLSNSLWEISQNTQLCSKLLCLNKVLNSVFISYKAKLPDIFLLGHPIGSIIGNAKYNDFLVVFQNVTINTNSDELGNLAPNIGRGVFLGAGAKIIGNKKIGNYSSIGVDALVYNREIPDNSVVIKTENGNVFVKARKKKECMAQKYFNVSVTD